MMEVIDMVVNKLMATIRQCKIVMKNLDTTTILLIIVLVISGSDSVLVS